MKKIFLYILIAISLTLSISAQENQLKLIDSFNRTNLEELRSRFNSVGLEMVKTPNSKMLVKIYGGESEEFA